MLLSGVATARADIAGGATLAQRWCANCHIIDSQGTGRSVPQGPPSFHTIAGHLSVDQLRAFLTHPHGAMPDLALTRAEIDDLLAYIAAQR